MFLTHNTLIFPTLIYIPANTGHSPNVISMLGHRLRRWPDIGITLGEHPVFAGMILSVFAGMADWDQCESLSGNQLRGLEGSDPGRSPGDPTWVDHVTKQGKAKTQYLLTLPVSRYYLLDLQSSISLYLLECKHFFANTGCSKVDII